MALDTGVCERCPKVSIGHPPTRNRAMRLHIHAGNNNTSDPRVIGGGEGGVSIGHLWTPFVGGAA